MTRIFSFQLEEMTLDRCEGLQVCPPSSFYPVHYSNWQLLFTSNASTEIMEEIKAARAVHMWNSMSKDAEVDEDSPYMQLAREYCPIVYDGCEGKF